MQSTAQLWLVYRMTNSPALLGIFGFASQIPILFLASVGGYVGDRYNRHRGVIWTQTVAMIIALLMMRLEKFEPRAHKGSPLQNFVQGFRFAMSDRPIRSALLLVSLMSLLGMQYSVFMPIFARDILHGGPSRLGLLMSFAGVGAIVGALHFAGRTDYKGLVEWIAATSTTCSLGI